MKKIIILFVVLLPAILCAQKTKHSFRVVPLGTMGGINEGNLSAYMLAVAGTNEYICLDAGTVYAGIEMAIAKHSFAIGADEVHKKFIKGYFISHAHLDHVAGLIITSPEDSAKTVYALPSCMKLLEEHYFNGETWANFGDEGKGFLVKKYHFQRLITGEFIPVDNTALQVKPFSLSHVNPYESTAFLIKNKEEYVVYLGDTGPDEIEKLNKLHQLWDELAPLIKLGKLKGIFIEVSFPNDQPNDKLFGHLTPKWLMKEMQALSSLTGKAAMQNFPVIITHAKPPAYRINKLKSEIKKQNTLGLHIIFPEQGKSFML